MTAARCENILPPGRRCNAPMREGMDGIGRVLWTCERCEARAAGRCWQCGRMRQNRSAAAAYCDGCGRKRDRASQRASASTPEQKKKKREADRRRRHAPGFREQSTAAKRAYMAAHPEKYATYAERAREKWRQRRADPEWWERQKAMQRAAYAARMAARRAAQCLDRTDDGPTFDGAGQPPAQP